MRDITKYRLADGRSLGDESLPELGSFYLGAFVVAAHDQEGIAAELGIPMLAERGLRVAALGIVLECAARGLPERSLQEILAVWRVWYSPSPAEARLFL